MSNFGRLIRTMRAPLICTALLALAAQSACAEPGLRDSTFWRTSAQVTAMSRLGDTLFIAGGFGQLGPETGNTAVLSRQTGMPQQPWPRVWGVVERVLDDGSGGWLVGGVLTSVGGRPCSNLVRIHADGTVDGWSPSLNGRVRTMLRMDRRLYVGGAFTAVEGQPRGRGACYDLDSGALLPWDPAANNDVYAMTASDSVVWVGGDFTQLKGQPAARLGVVSASLGEDMGWRASPNGSVRAIAVAESTVLIGGDFTLVNGVTRTRVAEIGRTSGLLTTWNPGADGVVTALLVRPDFVVAAGAFRNSGGAPRPGVAKLDRNTGNATPWSPLPQTPPSSYNVNAMLDHGDTLYLGTAYSMNQRWRPGPHNLVAVSISTGDMLPCGLGPDQWVSSLALQDSRLCVGGAFTNTGARWQPALAAMDVRDGGVLPIPFSTNLLPLAMVRSGNRIVLAGYSEWSVSSRSRIDVFDARTGMSYPWHVEADGPIMSLAAFGDTVYMGGQFSYLNGQYRKATGAVDLRTGTVLDWTVQGAAYGSLMPVGERLFAALGVASNGTILGGPIEIDRRTGVLARWGPTLSWASTMVRSGPRVIVGGDFCCADGTTVNGIVALDAQSGARLEWALGSYQVGALAVLGNQVLVGFADGVSAACGGVRARYLETGELTSWCLETGTPVHCIEAGMDRVFTGTDAGVLAWTPPAQSAPSVRLLYPNGGESLPANSPQALRWEASSPDRITGVDLLWSADSGLTWSNITSNVPNTGAFSWNVPDTSLAHVRVKVIARDPLRQTSEDVSDADVAIIRVTPAVTVLSPNGGEQWLAGTGITVRWSATGDVITSADVDASFDGGSTWPLHVAAALAGADSLSWLAPDTSCAHLRIRVTAHTRSGGVGMDMSDGDASILRQAATASVLAPNGGESWLAGTTHVIRWTSVSDDSIAGVDLFWTPDSGAHRFPIATRRAAQDSFPWWVTDTTCSTARVVAVAHTRSGGGGEDMSDADFEIWRHIITVTSSPGGSVRPNGLVPVPNTGSVIFTITPDPWWYVTDVVADGVSHGVLPSWSFFWVLGPHTLHVQFGTMLEADSAPVTDFTITAPSPNPVRGRGNVRFGLPRAERVHLGLYDVQGREVRTLAYGEQSAGWHHAALDAGALEAGMYFLRLQAPGITRTQRIALLR